MCEDELGLDHEAESAGSGVTRRTFLHGAAIAVGVGAVEAFGPHWMLPRASASTTRQFFRMDPHVHCVVSGDAIDDVGILAAAATAPGANPYDLIFITDHHLASRFYISDQASLHGTFSGTVTGSAVDPGGDAPAGASKWTAGTFGSASQSSVSLAASPVNTSPYSLHLVTQSTGYSEAFAWYKRGPNLYTSGATITFAVYPVRVDPGCAIFISASLGGDGTVFKIPDGYTTKSDSQPRPGRNAILVWQLGGTKVPLFPPSAPGGTAVYYQQLGGYQLNAWNTYTVDVGPLVTQAVNADAPLDCNALTHMKMAVAADNGGTVECYFDSWLHQASLSLSSEDEFALRNKTISTWNTSQLTVMPGIELGLHSHVQRFNFADATQWKDYTYGDGTNGSPDGIADVQATGYPAMLNHPGLPGGCSMADAINYDAFNADIMETVSRGSNDVMLTIWDAILSHGVPLVGAWSSDAHRTGSLGPCTYVQSAGKDLNSLMAAWFEGRAFMAHRSFGGTVIVNLADGSAVDCYPARYPVLVPAGTTSAQVAVAVSGGPTSSTVAWIANNAPLTTQTLGNSSGRLSVAVPLSATSRSYVRAELSSGGSRYAMTQAIMFQTVAGWPTGHRLLVTGIVTADGVNYTKAVTKGILGATYDTSTATLALTLTNPVGAMVSMAADAPDTPNRVAVDGTSIPVASSKTAFDSATSSSWFVLGAALWIKILHSAANHTVSVHYASSTGDVTPPTVPASVTATQPTQKTARISWQASTDNVRVAGYTVYRDGIALATLAADALSYDDSTIAASTTYKYTVDAFDAAGNRSPQSAAATLTTADPPVSQTIIASADAYVSAQYPTANFGNATTLSVDADPVRHSYLRFAIPATAGSLVSATLQLYPNSSQSTGYDVYGVSDDTWTETGITWNNAPPMGTTKIGSSGKVTAGVLTSVDVTALLSTTLVNAGGDVNLALLTTSTTALSLASRQAASNRPQLVLTTTAVKTGSLAAPSGLTATQTQQGAVALSWNPPSGGQVIDHYTVFRNSVQLTTVPGTTTGYTDSSVQAGSTYSYQVSATDTQGDTSALCAPQTITVSAAADTTAPSVPTGLTATVSSSGAVTLNWSASTDDVGVTGYLIYRNSARLATVGGATLTYDDASVQPNTAYSYQVAATDAAGNTSALSAAATVTTPAAGAALTLTPAADAYVNLANPAANYGKSTQLRVDAGNQSSYLRFAVPATAATVVSAVLRLFATSSQSVGYDVYGVADDTWTESGITWNNAPPMAATRTGSSGKVASGTWTSVDVTPLVPSSLLTSGGDVNLGLATTSTQALALSSREGANPPQLVITYH